MPDRRHQRDHRWTDADPTPNVMALTKAANRRQDDLRVETNRRIDAEIIHLRELGTLRAAHTEVVAALRATHATEIRTVDVENGAARASQALTAIQTLDVSTNTKAESLRTNVSDTAAAIAQQQSTREDGINKRLAALEQLAAVGIGKEKVADPALEKLTEVVGVLARLQASASGESKGISATVALGIAVVTILVALFAGGAFHQQAAVQPSVIYTPAPFGTQLPSLPPAVPPR